MNQPSIVPSVDEKTDGGPEDQGGAPFPPEADLTGQERLAWNVFAGWAGYLVVAATGFLAPRIMDRKLGQESLGVWDFGWSLVSYFGLTQLGVGSSVQRYVAKYRAAGDVASLRIVTSSATGFNLVASACTLFFTAVCAWLVPHMLHTELASEVRSARWLVVLLGVTVATQMAMQVYQGVLAGCHRFDVLNAVTASLEILNSLMIIAVLYAGGGLVALGVVCLGFQLTADISRMTLAHRICPELRLTLADVQWGEARRLLKYGLKATVYSISSLLLIQANKLTVGGAFGLAALAVFSRPLALIRMIETFAAKFAYVLVPTSSSLQSSGQHEKLSLLLLHTARVGTGLALPMILFLAILGDQVMLIWMGSRYQPGPSMLILSLGFLGAVALAPVSALLFGMNLHGWPALAALIAAAASALLGMLNASLLGWGLTGPALAVALPLTASQVFLSIYACRKFDLPLSRFVGYAFGAPLACIVPFALALLASRVLFQERPLLAILAGALAGAATIPPLYWRFVIPEGMRLQIRGLPAQWRAARLLKKAGAGA
jgi:O-antigen/teichoic acid export membrane protein